MRHSKSCLPQTGFFPHSADEVGWLASIASACGWLTMDVMARRVNGVRVCS